MNEIARAEDFQTRMFNRIRENMGDLLTDEDLTKLVAQAMDKAFFAPRVTQDGYGRREEKPPLFVELLEKEMKPQVQAAVTAYVQAHPEEMAKAVQESLSKGFFNLAVGYFESKTSWPLQQLATAIGTNLAR